MDDWGVGEYEDTAAELAPVADVAVEALRLAPGETLLDVACGTGNAAAVAAAVGARVTGLDGSQRLVDVARERIPSATFVHGDAVALPFDDGAFDAVVSVFGVIFAQPAEQAAAELARVTRPGGRVAITSWLPRGSLAAAVGALRRAMAEVRPPDGPPPADWGDHATLQRLLGGFGELTVEERVLTGAPTTAEAIWDRWERRHPVWIRSRAVLEPLGRWAGLREETIAALRAGAVEDGPQSPYLLVRLRRA